MMTMKYGPTFCKSSCLIAFGVVNASGILFVIHRSHTHRMTRYLRFRSAPRLKTLHRDQVDELTGSRAIAAVYMPAEHTYPADNDALCHDAKCIPDTPPEKPSPALACLTPSAMALLQPGAVQSSPQQHRRVYAPASLFPGFATSEKLQPQPAASEYLQGQALAASNQQAQQLQKAPIIARHQTRSSAPGDTHSSTCLQHSQDVNPSHSAPAHRQHSQSRHSKDLTSHASDASTRSRGQALSDTAFQGQRASLHLPVSAARQGGEVSSEQLSVAAQGSQEGRPSSGQLGKQQALQGSLAQPRAVLQPKSGQSGQCGYFQDSGRGQPWAMVGVCDLFKQGHMLPCPFCI